MIEETQIAVLHRTAEPEHIAFYVRRKWKPGDRMDSDNVVLLDGTSPKDADIMVCGTCKLPIHPTTLRYIDEVPDTNILHGAEIA